MFSKPMTLIAGLTAAALMGLAVPTIAQAQTYYVKANAVTGGFAGTYADYTNGTTYTSAESNPGGLQFNNGYGLVYAEAYAASEAAQGHLSGRASSTATRISATAFSNATPYGSIDTSFTDTIKVQSATLPAGTPVTLVFRHEVGLTWEASGLYTGSVYSSLRVGATTVSTRWDKTHKTADPGIASQTITVQTTVGSRISMTGVLRGQATSRYFEPGPSYSGQIQIEASADCILESATPGVTIVADSGANYLPL